MKLARIAAALAAGFVVMGVGSAFADTTVTMWTFLDPTKAGGRESALKTMIEGFEKANPGIHIKVEPQVWTTLAEKFVLGSNAGNAPDIGWVNAENLGLVVNSDAAADLKPIVIDKWSAERKADLVMPKALDAVTLDGKILAVPLMSTTWVMMYRKDLFKAAGIDPKSIETWDGVTAAAKKLTTDKVWGMGLGLASERFSATPSALAAFDASDGFFDNDCKVKFDNEGSQKAVQLQVDWITKDKVSPREALSMTSDDAIDQFSAGRYAMEVIANSRFEQIQRNAAGWDKDALGMAPIPGWTPGKLGPEIASGWFAVAWSKSPNLDAAAKFIDYMSSAESMALWNLPGGQVPMMKSVAARPEMNDPANKPLKDVASFLEANARFTPGACNWSRTYADFNLATQQVVLGQLSVADAVKQAAKATQDRQ